MRCYRRQQKFFYVLVMVRLATALVTDARMAGRATLVPMEVAILEATMRAEAIVMDRYVMGGERVMKGRVEKY